MVRTAVTLGRQVFHELGEVPGCASEPEPLAK